MPGSADGSYRFGFTTVSGGAEEDRTPDLLRARQALSQLSYGPVVFPEHPELRTADDALSCRRASILLPRGSTAGFLQRAFYSRPLYVETFAARPLAECLAGTGSRRQVWRA